MLLDKIRSCGASDELDRFGWMDRMDIAWTVMTSVTSNDDIGRNRPAGLSNEASTASGLHPRATHQQIALAHTVCTHPPA